jgi:mannose-6-phosphate isomerase-like protein (cupin superfamily)
MQNQHRVKHLACDPDYIAPDGSEVRLLIEDDVGGMAHFRLPHGMTSKAVVHATVREFWYVLSGEGEMWRFDQATETVVSLNPGTCVEILPGTRFQFRTLGSEPLNVVAATIPRWPGPQEAAPVTGKWP